MCVSNPSPAPQIYNQGDDDGIAYGFKPCFISVRDTVVPLVPIHQWCSEEPA